MNPYAERLRSSFCRRWNIGALDSPQICSLQATRLTAGGKLGCAPDTGRILVSLCSLIAAKHRQGEEHEACQGQPDAGADEKLKERHLLQYR